MKKNILFSTTRQWNPGDEFILMGCINLLKEVVGEFNPIIYNRNPEVRQSYNYTNPFRKSKFCNINFKGKSLIESFFRIGFWDNSFKDDTPIDFIDLVVFAGSPEWFGGRLYPLYKKILEHDIPTIFLGIGSGCKFEYSKIDEIYKEVLKKSKLITVRDEYTYKQLEMLNPHYLPCPALFSSPLEKQIKEAKKIGLIFGTDKAVVNNRVNSKTCSFIINGYKKLIDNYGCEIVCHYIDEVPEACRLFKNVNVHYSYDSKDYLDIYNKFDLVIGPRVHGIGMSASMGIPGILISHDMRGDTGKGFMAKIIGNDIPYNMLSNIVYEIVENIGNYNRKLIDHKHLVKQKYIGLLNTILR
jgi:polysaccharide pyruvyl transferase WcaK-like protein